MQNNTKIKQLLQAQKKKTFYYVLTLSLLAYSLPRFVHLVSCPRTLLGQCRWNGLSKDTGFTRSFLCASNETDISNNISKAGESEAAMQTLSNYCCGPMITAKIQL